LPSLVMVDGKVKGGNRRGKQGRHGRGERARAGT